MPRIVVSPELKAKRGRPRKVRVAEPYVPSVKLIEDGRGVVWYEANGVVKRVKESLLDIEKGIAPGELGKLAKARLHNKLLMDMEGDPKELGYIRTAMETDGLLGGPSELHLHQHTTLPPAVQRMLESKMAEIMNLNKLEVLDGASISEGAESAGQGQEDHDGV